MSILEAIVLGIVQGLTEFLPISSTAHLRIVPAFAGWPDPGAAFTAITQLGTMAAVLIYFRRELWRIARTWIKSLRDRSLRGELDARLGWYLLVGTIPIAILGFLFQDQIETSARSLYLIGAALIALGLLLLMAEKLASHERKLESVRLRDGVVVGLAQAGALVPGVSRSGATITAALFLGLERADAARFSFLLSVPAVVLSGLFELVAYLRGDEGEAGGVLAVAIATALAFVVGYASIAFLLRFLVTHTTTIFVVYRVMLGTVVLVLVAAGVIS
jgi:undecaprenyl-diphosphatase